MNPQSLSNKIRVAVLRGGPSPDYDASLQTGEHVLKILRDKPEYYHPVDIFISKEGDWHKSGMKVEPHKSLEHVDVVWNALHGAYGEDGNVQKILSSLHIPFTGSSTISSAISTNKDMSKRVYEIHGLFTPRHELITAEDEVEKLVHVFRNYLHPLVVKPATAESMRGIRLAYTFDELVKAVDEALEFSDRVLVEEFVRGKEAACSVIENAHGEELYALIPVEIRTPEKNKRPDYDKKFSTAREHLSENSFTANENRSLEYVAKKAHQALGLRHYSRSDLILTPQGKIYVLETSSQPSFGVDSSLPKSLDLSGWSSEGFLEHVLNLALKNK
ncbi:MAG: D-alanine-D-alanine ligase [Parcubacteria bacterium C7867-005]|nr:MAG: D-alanine-D-alanine ligase [Parcubacteria bacterium C7867-005]